MSIKVVGWRGFLCHRRLRWPRRGCALVLALVGAWHIAVWSGSYPGSYLLRSTASSLIIRNHAGQILRQEMSQGGSRESWKPLQAISLHLQQATLASEDNGFYGHAGVDWSALGRAAWLNLRGKRLAYGGSTLTMQLVRLTAHSERTLLGKIAQTVLAARLERSQSKREILEQYLNRVYYGNGAWGAEQASQLYFGKRASELSLGQAAMLAVFPRGPSRYNPYTHRARARARRDHILGLMEKHGYIGANERDLAMRIPLRIQENRSPFTAPHFSEFVKRRLPKKFANASTVTTTLDGDLQRRVELAVAAHVDALAGRNLTQAAAVVLRNSDGAILAMVGSRDYHDEGAHGSWSAVTARLRPGSTLKPFVYGTALEAGDTPATMAYDVALPKDRHQFYVKDVKQHGFARYRESLASSYNLSAVHTLQRVGVAAVLRKLRTAGLRTLDAADEDYDWGLAIGHAEVRLLDLTAAFSTFGRGGTAIVPRVIDEARTPGSAVYREPKKVSERVFGTTVSYQIYDILSDPDARKPMFGDRVPMNLGFKVALKTGTTKAYTDLWAVGVTKEYTVGVWGGNFDGSPTHRIMSLQGATPLLRAVYTAIASRYGRPSSPPMPESLVRADVCPLSGMRPGPHCEHRKSELFVMGTVPEEVCTWHQEVCGAPVIVLPEPLRRWARATGYRSEGVEPSGCALASVEREERGGDLRILAPMQGAHFVLEPHRDPRSQAPPLAALHAGENARWFIDDQPAEAWVPTPGTHTVRVARGQSSDEVTIVYE